MADALGVDVRHALRDVYEEGHDRAPVALFLRREKAFGDRLPHAPAVAVLLHALGS